MDRGDREALQALTPHGRVVVAFLLIFFLLYDFPYFTHKFGQGAEKKSTLKKNELGKGRSIIKDNKLVPG